MVLAPVARERKGEFAQELERWQAQAERLGRFFGPGLRADIQPGRRDEFSLALVPQPGAS